MANERFDELVKRITEARLTRQDALRGLAGAAAAAAGAAFASEETTAKKGRKGRKAGKVKSEKNGNQGKVTICHCPPGNPDNCHTISVGSKAAAAHLRNHENDSEGECEEGTTTTTAEPTTTTAEPTTTTAEPTTTTTAGIAAANRGKKAKRRRRGK
jgi:hypothetical protein